MNAPYAIGDAENEVVALYNTLISNWNSRNAAGMAELVIDNVNFIGFDGSLMTSPGEIKTSLTGIFANHPTAAYITIIRQVYFITENVVMLRADVGMMPPGETDINPAVNAIQTLIAVKENGVWKIASFQNTPAAFHGRPEMSEQFSMALRGELNKSSQ